MKKKYDEIKELEEQSEILEEEVLKLQSDLPQCDRCCKPVEKFNHEGWEYCDDCYDSLDYCETCGAIGSYGTNTEPNNIYNCWTCGVTYCDECPDGHDCPDDEED